jgi:1,4-alpha-glucan branching enzyme
VGYHAEIYHFVVVCPHASAVFLLGEFNGWSTTATPMHNTEEDVWQIDVEMAAGQDDFSYFVIDDRWQTGQAPFGNTFMLPGTWARLVRTPAATPEPRHVATPEPPPHVAVPIAPGLARPPRSGSERLN